MAETESRESRGAGYFNLPDRSEHSPDSIRSNDSSVRMGMSSSTAMASLAAFQYLPIPLIVLSSEKKVVVANEAMGRLLGIDFESTATEGISVSESLRGQCMGELGIDIIQHGSPIMVSWEVRSR